MFCESLRPVADEAKDYIRTPRSQRRPKLWPVGLYFQRHQEISRESGFRASRSICSDHDRPFYGCICEAPDPNLS